MNELYPKTLNENLKERAQLLISAEHDATLQAAVKEMCRRDRLYWINLFCYTYDPRTQLKSLPFITYKYQDDVILWDAKCAVEGVDNFIDKSRDMGATWILIANDVYDWLFSKEKIEIRWGSRKEQYVDTRGDMDSLFEKMRYIVNNLPIWMLPAGYHSNMHDNSMRLVNPETGSSITGEATNSNFGRGGRKYRVRFDEFAFWDCDDQAWDGCADVTKCRTALSTPNGSSNKFAELSNNDMEFRRLHWTLHPEKVKGCYKVVNGEKVLITQSEAIQRYNNGLTIGSTWYDIERKRRCNDKSVAQELDIDYQKSNERVVITRALLETCVDVVAHSVPSRRIIAIDPSTGGDECPVYYMEDYEIKDELYLNVKDTMKIVGEVSIFAAKHKCKSFSIDCVGLGKGIADRLAELGYNVLFINSAENAKNQSKFNNVRTEIWWKAMELLQDKRIPVPKDEILVKQLTAVKYKDALSSSGQICLVIKKETKKDLGQSPDRADTWIYGVWGTLNIHKVENKRVFEPALERAY